MKKWEEGNTKIWKYEKMGRGEYKNMEKKSTYGGKRNVYATTNDGDFRWIWLVSYVWIVFSYLYI